ncbi:hypothetical protein SY88_06665 [Clostridiales bacterium PH28_bin88]|nr:hypothetical protein SY88_06665 [Clostridiales bacterium PH28_bin88]
MWKEQRGQGLAELALLLPVLLLLVMGMMEFGRVSHAYLAVTNAAREGARAAAVGAPDAQIIDVVKASAGSLAGNSLEITIDPQESSRQRGQPVRVAVRYGVAIISPVIQSVVPNPVWVTGETSMRVE